MLLPIKLLIPIREDCMLQDQNPQESTSLPFFPYQNNFYEAYKLSSNLWSKINTSLLFLYPVTIAQLALQILADFEVLIWLI